MRERKEKTASRGEIDHLRANGVLTVENHIVPDSGRDRRGVEHGSCIVGGIPSNGNDDVPGGNRCEHGKLMFRFERVSSTSSLETRRPGRTGTEDSRRRRQRQPSAC